MLSQVTDIQLYSTRTNQLGYGHASLNIGGEGTKNIAIKQLNTLNAQILNDIQFTFMVGTAENVHAQMVATVSL